MVLLPPDTITSMRKTHCICLRLPTKMTFSVGKDTIHGSSGHMDAYPAREWKTVIQGSFKSAKLKQILKEACELLAERSKIDVVAACITPDF